MTSGVGLFLPGGGATGCMYQIAVLAALEDALDGWSANDFSMFLGASSGATVATALAGSCEVRRMYRALLDPADDYFPLERKHILKMDIVAWARAGVTVGSAVRKGMSSAISRSPQASPAALWDELDRLYDSLPAGFFSLDRYERFLSERLSRRGVGNSFKGLARPLRIIAHDLESGEPVVFGSLGKDDVPVTRACTASMALPPIFSPVRVGERRFINAGAAQVQLLDVAATEHLSTVVVVNPMVPLCTAWSTEGHSSGEALGERGALGDRGAMWITDQSNRISLQALLGESCRRLTDETGIRFIVIEPEPADTLLFTDNPASFSARRAILEQVYRTTRERVSKWPLEKLSMIPPPPSDNTEL